ncbi:hypothetical protein LTR74_013656 [Friedmanniomyces endolithicus]|nr:hypothetical protein LTR74_013656 [Friedmanniomyces endolithicus]
MSVATSNTNAYATRSELPSPGIQKLDRGCLLLIAHNNYCSLRNKYPTQSQVVPSAHSYFPRRSKSQPSPWLGAAWRHLHLKFAAMESSPLLKLPPELRNYIYELTFTNPPIELTWTTHDGSVPRPEPHSNRRLGLALTATCKQVKQECGRMLYADNDFVISCRLGKSGYSKYDTGYADIVRRFIATVGFGNALAVRTLTLTLTQARMDMRQFGPVIEQLYPLCRTIQLPLTVLLNRPLTLHIEMLQLRRTGNLAADVFDAQPGTEHLPRTRFARDLAAGRMSACVIGGAEVRKQPPKVDLLSGLRRITAVACEDSATHGR